jgi:Ca2+-binding RTX toxin-like protein
MWEAPQRIGTGYPGAGFEISASGFSSTGSALEGWKGSPGHDSVIVNEGIWASQTWNAIGIGVELHETLGRIYHVWFGREADPDGAGAITGTAGGDTIRGTAFDDLISGGGAGDTISGGAGRDRIKGGGGGDDLSGEAGRDRLLGMNGRDDLSGGGGRDTLIGGKGKDSLTGGAGSDLFLFKAANFGTDRITDYNGDRVRILTEGEAETLDALQDALWQKRGNVIYDHGDDGHNRIVFEGVTLADLDLSLFDLG